MALAADSKSLYIPISTIYGKPNADGTYTLNALDVKNLNDNLYAIAKKIQGGLTTSDLTSAAIDELHAGTVISNTVITNNLYATYGDVAELTVDRLITADKVQRYKNKDTSDVNYVKIQGHSIQLVTGTTTGTTAQHIDRNGDLLYWTGETKTSMGTDVTAYPVMVYEYTELVKAEMSFYEDNGVYVPRIVMGAGTGTGNNDKLIICKEEDKATIKYTTDSGIEAPIEFTEYVDAKMRRITSAAINKSAGTIAVTMEGESFATTLNYTETETSMTFAWPDNHTATVSIS